ncbi:hypothetical protein [Halalkalicoccus jeotgali]|uniref:Uncharacterized protein n=1 Tax=Halalkalicoccus jeotgali (strain DSM 18796 / CECT 7217 / JCM 14584 / KCTC 4019 / B3) TaxID=795797 RepID=D8JA04_HALJB|nr:hypothetical protein [Halalkalicoccus jeotgali]ADJ14526.1 hypothetical protein HacjB3_05675 [Halalkalicoccus jeotgali B3]ELY40098.1 hypothetical protein C497_04040 [Halalkalicoccus jeotgali B3]
MGDLDTVEVSSYGDLIGDPFLNVVRADAVVVELNAGRELVAYAPDWLVGQKDYPSTGGGEVVAGSIIRETDDAILLGREDDEAWFPKSQILVFEAIEGVDLPAPKAADEGEGAA